MRSQAADLALARACATTSDMPAGCRELIMMPPCFISAERRWHRGALGRRHGGLAADFNPAEIIRTEADIESHSCHRPSSRPCSIIRTWSNTTSPACKSSAVRRGADVGAATERGLDKLGPIFTNCYGATESGATIILQKRFHRATGAEQEIERLGSLGQEHHDSRVRIVDDAGNECPRGTREIVIRCASLMDGYWNKPEATAAALANSWLHTGDVGRMDADGLSIWSTARPT